MAKPSNFLWLVCVIAVGRAEAQQLSLKWGLENTWSYSEVRRSEGEDLSVRSKSTDKKYRAFEFKEKSEEVLKPFLGCLQRHEDLWRRYEANVIKKKYPAGLPKEKHEAEQKEFESYKKDNDPFCREQAKKQAPRLYFDFVANTADSYVLEKIEVNTLNYSEYRGGGFAEKEAWYDLILSPKKGIKAYEVEPRLVFSNTGRVQLRFWSGNFYPIVGWMAPMGEYTLEIIFAFTVKGRTVRVKTGAFKMDV